MRCHKSLFWDSSPTLTMASLISFRGSDSHLSEAFEKEGRRSSWDRENCSELFHFCLKAVLFSGLPFMLLFLGSESVSGDNLGLEVVVDGCLSLGVCDPCKNFHSRAAVIAQLIKAQLRRPQPFWWGVRTRPAVWFFPSCPSVLFCS